jgi:hypothetical protein
MTIATVLVKPDVPNYSLLGKLCLGIAVELESFVSTMRSKSSIHMARMESGFLTYTTFQINVQRAVGLYFLSRSLWNSSEYGVAIAAMSEATVAMKTRTSPTGRGEQRNNELQKCITHPNLCITSLILVVRLTRDRRKGATASIVE